MGFLQDIVFYIFLPLVSLTFILVIVHPTAVLLYQNFGIFTTVKLRVGGGLGLSFSPMVIIGTLPFPADGTRPSAGPH